MSEAAVRAIDLAGTLLAVPVFLASAYLALLAVLSRRTAAVASTAPSLRFDVVVPAHDEEATIAETVRGLSVLAYPRSLYRVLVVADNCDDGTADAAARAGAQVLVRHEPARRGKGHALACAFEHVLADGFRRPWSSTLIRGGGPRPVVGLRRAPQRARARPGPLRRAELPRVPVTG